MNAVATNFPPRIKKIYEGSRGPGGRPLVCVREGALRRELAARKDLANHSPDGFEWSYAGSGPAQLALAILADHFGDDRRALAIYQSFKFKIIAALPREQWLLTEDRVETSVREIEAAVERRA